MIDTFNGDVNLVTVMTFTRSSGHRWWTDSQQISTWDSTKQLQMWIYISSLIWHRWPIGEIRKSALFPSAFQRLLPGYILYLWTESRTNWCIAINKTRLLWTHVIRLKTSCPSSKVTFNSIKWILLNIPRSGTLAQPRLLLNNQLHDVIYAMTSYLARVHSLHHIWIYFLTHPTHPFYCSFP